jgi:oxygen-independent coproporphyrinogen-3 oxidase
MFGRAQEIFAAAGYSQYEISNYARPGRECRHNLNYWQGGDYLGVGAGAHSFSRVPLPGLRWSNEKIPAVYLERVGTSGGARVSEETLTQRQAQGEVVFLALRCRAGLDFESFAERFGVSFVEAFPHVSALARDGLIERGERRWRLTDRGLLVADSVFATFV